MFAADGPLAAKVEGYVPRAQQLEMAEAILAAIQSGAALAVEAGTGTGKTFAYLAPALLAGGKVIVSTGTKTLQNQLYDRDLPAVREALAAGSTAALLKGRANYVCLYRLERARTESRLESREDAVRLARIEQFAARSLTGDRADLAEVPEDAPVWQHATSTRDNCLGQECPKVKDCFVMQARRNALAADIVVVNHHLFFADVALRDEGVAELLPACNTVIFDEAHQLPETARLFFGDTLSTAQMVELARDTRLELRAAGGASPDLDRVAAKLDKAARDLRLVFAKEGLRLGWPQALRERGFNDALDGLAAAIEGLRAPLAEAAATLSDARPSLIVFHCTANSMESGLAHERAIVDTVEQASGCRSFTTAQAITRAFDALGLRRIVLLSPYTAETNLHEVQYLAEAGYRVVHEVGLALSPPVYSAMPPEDWIALARANARDDVDGYFLSCTNTRMIEAIGAVERELGKPVVTSNQATLWWCLESLGIRHADPRLGRLMTSLR